MFVRRSSGCGARAGCAALLWAGSAAGSTRMIVEPACEKSGAPRLTERRREANRWLSHLPPSDRGDLSENGYQK